MNAFIDIQIATNLGFIPTKEQLTNWALSALPSNKEICIRIVDKTEIKNLNNTYRKKDKPTNVLSFPTTTPIPGNNYLGDIIICAQVVEEEALEQKKTVLAHFAHMIIHGILHLQGFDHETKADANIMEPLEIKILTQLGFNNPYEE